MQARIGFTSLLALSLSGGLVLTGGSALAQNNNQGGAGAMPPPAAAGSATGGAGAGQQTSPPPPAGVLPQTAPNATIRSLREMDWDTARAVAGWPPDQFPVPMRYPMAAPGGINMYHWSNMTRDRLRPGSVHAARWYRDRLLNEQRAEEMRKLREGMSGQSTMNGGPGFDWDNYYGGDYYGASEYPSYYEDYGDENEAQPLFYRRTTEIVEQNNGGSAGYQAGASYQTGVNPNYPTGMQYDRSAMAAMAPMRMPAMAAGGDYVYVVRGNTLYQLRSSDLTLATQRDIPAAGLTAGGYAGSGAASVYGNQGAAGQAGVSGQPGAANQPGDQYQQGQNVTPRRYRRRAMNGAVGANYSPMAAPPATVAVGGNYVYVLQGGTIYQFNTSDLSLVSQQPAPWNGAIPGQTGVNGQIGATGQSGANGLNGAGSAGVGAGATGTGAGQNGANGGAGTNGLNGATGAGSAPAPAAPGQGTGAATGSSGQNLPPGTENGGSGAGASGLGSGGQGASGGAGTGAPGRGSSPGPGGQ